ncbi:MAG TPA: PEP/pyruvate-binding domain-containing protein [Streptosporangiaceae bacterium]|nr:PEP/pyruvate-binding domain-containing protein [Streptosporangiaceae bacterium]
MLEAVRDLGDVDAGDRALAGGKGAGLGELIGAGIPVPAGFVVTVGAFECAMRALDPAGEVRREAGRLPGDDAAAIAEATARVRARIATAPLPPDVRDQVEAAYRRLSAADSGARNRGAAGAGGGAGETGGVGEAGGAARGGGGVPVAVRSSATSEDGAETSFAGLQDTYLWVRGAGDLMNRVRACWASLYNAEAVAYRRRMKIAEHGIAMAVVVQRMVEPRCAGVMFTRSPTTGDRSVIAIEGCWGLGSALVGGDVTPDSFVVSKVTGEIVRRSVAVKLRLHRAGPGGAGIAAADVPAAMREQACLGDAELAALARLGRRVEEHYGAPQDIEWAITEGAGPGEFAIVLLQSRPETVWARRAAAPLATPRTRAVDHVFEQLGRVNVVRPER